MSKAKAISDNNYSDIITDVQDIPDKEAELAEQAIDIDLSYQSFKALLRERKQIEDRLIEINAELLLYRDTCNCILLDLKDGGLKS